MSTISILPITAADWEKFRSLRAGCIIKINGLNKVLRQTVVEEDVDANKNCIHWTCDDLAHTSLTITNTVATLTEGGQDVDIFSLSLVDASPSASYPRRLEAINDIVV